MTPPIQPGRFFLPGPTEVTPDVLAAQTQPMIGHRGRDIQELLARISAGLKPVFQTQRPVIVSTSAASGLMEAAVRNGIGAGRALGLVNGAFSARFSEIARLSGHQVEVWEVPWGEVHPPEELASRLEAGDYEAVMLTHSETSTGALQDLESIASVVARHPGTLLLVDSVTGVAGVETHTDEWRIDFILTGSQKALALPPGLSFAVASDAMMERARGIADRGWYFDIIRLIDGIESDQTPATPAVSLLYALDLQLGRIADEGIEQRWKRHLRMQEMTLSWVEEMRAGGLDVGVLAAEGHRSPTVTCVTVPGGAQAPELVAAIKTRGWVIGGGYGKLKDSTVRIGHMGDHTTDGLGELLEVMTSVFSP